uniref:protein adenylyltransferase n=1 Tax=Plectus sambesii TaxID=2011161 RepID=A0A914UPZ0_9BILA
MVVAHSPDRLAGGTSKEESIIEALATLNAAVEFRKQGKYEKAKRILEHAVALAPTQPDVLIEFGLYMETVQKDVLEAQSMYTKALAYNPSHRGALSNRQRTLPLVEAIDNQMLHDIDEKRKWFLKIDRSNPSLRRAMGESYFQHVYHTVALEGNTMSLIQTRSILETHVAVAGKSIVEHNEILGMDAALRYLNSNLVHRLGEVTIEDILNIHQRVLGFVDPIQAGNFRNTQVYVGSFTPVHPDNVEADMDDFVQWLNAEDTMTIPPVELAALAHYKFVYIHPFVDGNGRTARLLMNLILMQAGYPPVIINVNDRLRYYETLKMANDGDLRPFIRFIASCTDQSLDYYLNSVTVGGAEQRTDERQSRHAELGGDRIGA